jgi:hypothetical protein
MSNAASFSIENTINSHTQLPFGSKYAGTFAVRRPSIGDKRAIALKDAAQNNAFGRVDADQIGEGLRLLSYIVVFVTHVADGKVPGWFDLNALFDETDENAVLAVWQEVQTFLDTFRPATAGGNSAGAAPGTASVVSSQV